MIRTLNLKKQLAPIMQDSFVIKRSVFNSCLEMYPMKEWNTMAIQVNQLNRFIKKNIDFIRTFMSGIKVVEADNNGRILVPKNLILFAGIEKEQYNVRGWSRLRELHIHCSPKG